MEDTEQFVEINAGMTESIKRAVAARLAFDEWVMGVNGRLDALEEAVAAAQVQASNAQATANAASVELKEKLDEFLTISTEQLAAI